MIGYSCKYAPLELIAAYGGKALMLDAETEDFSRAETLTHANVCCHAKALLTQALDISELVLTDCCDATRRTYDVLESEGRQRFLFQFDLPHDDAACARQRMTHELLRFAKTTAHIRARRFPKRNFSPPAGIIRTPFCQTSRLSRYSARASAPSFWGRSAAHSPSRWKT
ncbi:MAG: 2-hydroxyacyl-CoA dehydratase family protein [Christensenellales bacterium]